MLDSIESAIEDIKNGKLVIVVDDEDRENEGDFLTAAHNVTPEIINFMSKFGRGLICAPLSEDRCNELDLNLMVKDNTELHQTPFTVSVDLIGHGCTTGISAHDRAKTIQALIHPDTKPNDLAKPGHIFPLRARKEGVLRRAGHTEAAIDLARLAGFEPAGVIVEIIDEDGEMARLPRLKEIAIEHGLKIISIEELIEYRLRTENLVEEQIRVHMPTKFGDFELITFKNLKTNELHHALNQEGRGIGLLNKLKAYKLQEQGRDTVEANLELGFEMDERDYGIGAQILRMLDVSKIKLITNNPRKRAGLLGYGLEIVENVPIEICSNPHNEKYLQTKRDKLGHEIMR
jgi:3,4-dihydroxy 2-butanone 4-phosphate synthase/GTP cyclohydrolase II